MWITDPIPHEFQKSRIDDLVGGKLGLGAGRLIGQPQRPTIGIFIRLHLAHGDRMDADEMPRDPGYQPARGRDRPGFHVAFQEVCVRLNEIGRPVITALVRVHRRTGQRGDTHRERRWRVAAGFLPPLLRRDRSFADQIRRRLHHHGVGVKVL